jgi:hypothetical protein
MPNEGHRYFCPNINTAHLRATGGCWVRGKLGLVVKHINDDRHGGTRIWTTNESDRRLLLIDPRWRIYGNNS